MHEDEYVARLKIHRRHSSAMLDNLNKDRRLQRDQIKVQAELSQLMSDPKANRVEIEKCRNWLHIHQIATGPPPRDLTSRQRKIEMLIGYVPEDRKNVSTLRKFLGDV